MTQPPITADWIAADWGTSHLRVWAMADGADIAQAQSDQGMNRLSPGGFEAALLELIEPWLGAGTTPVVACGMVGARQGWVEAPYTAVPCTPLPVTPVRAQAADQRLAVWVVPGLKQQSPPDVMRGEETQIAGFLALNPNFDGVLCLPGTHTKWAQVSAGEVVSFQSFMTGELFASLAENSVLRHTVAPCGWDEGTFADALDDALSRPDRLAARLFTLRADALLNDTSGTQGRARLSGLLIGAELAAAKPYWLGQQVGVIGASAVAAPYVTALTRQGNTPVQADAAAMTRAGLIAAHRNIDT
ncbi:2-dehydro-3-deoxygalactonokinase [Meridianimarinicoccus aquatilis]|uniref:2-dehydro-3-deoxygalactonokinase n=1 Tax=Meridianimarinicoccus aquatilis TaxID=2552766 RepID=A0A4R6B456_9RHOB|nr:2-dehydro-3-deoxygalactonokinase [Fluviibacterium aquatile]TDL91134.1 2-dehydro-3-deoxygalactonokinase [Fluviibacterium aquatile]